MYRLLTAAAAAALMLVAGAGTASAQNFRALAEQDLVAAHDQLRDNHPAAILPGPAGDAFRAWLDAGLADSRTRVAQVNSGDSHAYLMRYYGRGFHDANISLSPTYTQLPPWFATSWPGFTTAWRNGAYVVSYVKPRTRGAPPLGAVLKSCDTVPVADMVTRRLAGWEADLTTEAGRVRSAPYLLWNRNNPFGGGVPGNCTFTVGRRDRDFRITTISADMAGQEAAYRATLYTPTATPLAVETVNGRPWVNVHSLADDAGWPAFFAQLEAQAETLRGPGDLVVDLRGANGSSLNATAKGYGVANRIWSPDFTISRQPPAGQITHRATAANRQWFADTVGRMQADPVFVQLSPQIITQTQEVVAAYDAAIAAGQATFTMDGPAPVADTGEANPVQGPVVVLVDAGCSGGCLDVVDLLLRLPNVRLAGTTTDVRSVFIEQTNMRLPSNYADLSYGHKAWMSRQQEHGRAHTPTLPYTGDPGDETAVRTWVGTLF